MTETQFTFTERKCKSIKPEPQTKEYSDTEQKGLKLIVTATGAKNWYFRYVFQGVKQTIKLGNCDVMSLEQARVKVRSYANDLAQGNNPKSEIKHQASMPTIKEFAEQYLNHTRNAKRSWKDDESKFRLHIVPTLGHLTIDKLGVKEIDIYRNRIKDSHTNATANRHLALLSSMLSLAVSWELISKNPALGLKRFKEQAKHEGTLNSDEISRFLMALEAERNLSAKNALKTLLLTGLRRGEVSNVKWEHLDVKNQQLLLPMTKAGKARFVPISMDAMEIMQSQAKISEYVFYGQDTSKPINNLTKPFHRVLERAGITKAVRIHDLRHTFASLAVSNGVSLFHVQALLGHSSPQMTQRYAHLQTATLLEASSNTAKAIIGE